LPDLLHETRLGAPVAGVDEAGRGPLAGPVTAAAVIVDRPLPAALARAIDDSKKLRPAQREALHAEILGLCHVGIGWASCEEIDRHNILQATFLAMRRAVAALPLPPRALLIDGNRVPKDLPCPAHTLVGGDGLSLSIAAASIVAKVERDREMLRLAAECPGYGWERNAGYGTAEHRTALLRLGPSPHHRRSFAPVLQRIAVTD